jgi:hypothetical protein
MLPSSVNRRAVLAAVLAVAAIAVLLAVRGAGSDPARTEVASAATPPPTAHAARRPVEKAIWGPVAMPDGASAFPVYKALGVDVFQVQLNWAATAPARPADPADPDDPAYRWPKLVDTAVAQGTDHGIQVAIMVRGTPGWANGGRDASWAPDDPADYAAFVTAAARRYPQVRRWMIWGEPTREGNFQPMPANSRTGPRRYALLLDAAYGALKAVNRANIVIGGMTWTVGLVRPADFVKWMRMPDGRPPRLDWYGHNPFSTRFPDLEARPYVKGIRDLSDIDTLHREVARAYRGRSAPKLWLSEFTISSDRANRAYNFSVTRKEQARWVRAAFRLVNSVDYVAGLGWFDLYDEDPSVANSLTNGLMTYSGRRKPAFSAYRSAP